MGVLKSSMNSVEQHITFQCMGMSEFSWRVFSFQLIFTCVYKPISMNDSHLQTSTHPVLPIQILPIFKMKSHCSQTFLNYSCSQGILPSHNFTGAKKSQLY